MKEYTLRVYKLLGLTASIELLENIHEGKNHYTDFNFAGPSVINARLEQLADLGLIEYGSKDAQTEEQYTLTEKGQVVVDSIEHLEKVLDALQE
jgi:DNA-binding HxlR family transcriptional regulator